MNYFAMVTTKSSGQYTPVALKTFYEFTKLGKKDRLFVIDNDGHYETMMRSHEQQYEGLEYIKNDAPRSFSGNVNSIIKLCLEHHADLFFLNNDVVFSSNWLESLMATGDSIATPISNRELQYDTNVFKAKMIMQLEDYIGKENGFEQLVEAHRNEARGVGRVLCLPFFCVRLPFTVLSKLGYFDENFGKAGGEDYDYCLRAHLAGFPVCYALSSYLLHFGGKSSYSGAETKIEQEKREFRFRTYFSFKWGMELARLILFEDRDILPKEYPHLVEVVQQGRFMQFIDELTVGREIKSALWEQEKVEGLPD